MTGTNAMMKRQPERIVRCQTCGALVVAYRSPDRSGRDKPVPWEFKCPRCGIDFVVSETALIFQSVPKEWLLAKVDGRVAAQADKESSTEDL